MLERLPGVLLAGGWTLLLGLLMGVGWVIRRAVRAVINHARKKET